MGSSLRILSANLWNGRAHPEAFADLVVALGVDLVAVQELSPEQAEALATVMPHGELEPARDYCGMGVVAQRPLKVSRVAMPYRDARVAHLDEQHWPQLQGPLELLNVHIGAPHMLSPHVGLAIRPRQMRELMRYLGTSQRDQRVLVGDLNATPLWPVYRRIASHLTDAAVTVARRRGRRVEPTWAPWHGAPRLIRIDHGFVAGVEVEDFRVVEVPGADHWAVVMDVAAAADAGEERSAE